LGHPVHSTTIVAYVACNGQHSDYVHYIIMIIAIKGLQDTHEERREIALFYKAKLYKYMTKIKIILQKITIKYIIIIVYYAKKQKTMSIK